MGVIVSKIQILLYSFKTQGKQGKALMVLPHISFEFFPPKTESGMDNLLVTAKSLAPINPSFFSVTFGAGGSAQTHTQDTVLKITQHTAIRTAAHISCVAEKERIKNLLHFYVDQGISRLVVLRGDLPAGLNVSPTTHFRYASELIDFIRTETQDYFHIDVACHPEFHPETTDTKKALFYFKEKINAGANSAITQYFYNPDAYFRFRDSCEKIGIHIPITPGIMPITNYEKLVSFSKACGAEIPRWLHLRLENFREDINALQHFGEEVVTALCEKLLENGAPGLHFYSLNKAEPSMKIIHRLGLGVNGWRGAISVL